MTIICAVRHEGDVWIGADSRATIDNFVCPVPHRKWREYGGWWIGLAGPTRTWWLLDKDTPKDSGHHFASMSAGEIGDCIHRLIDADKWTPDASRLGSARMFEPNMILVSPSREVYELGSSGTATAMGEEFAAMGSGYEYAMGAAFAAMNDSPIYRMRAAIGAACKYDTGCGGDLYVECLRQEKVGRPVLPQAPGVAEQTAASKNIPFGAWSR